MITAQAPGDKQTPKDNTETQQGHKENKMARKQPKSDKTRTHDSAGPTWYGYGAFFLSMPNSPVSHCLSCLDPGKLQNIDGWMVLPVQ